MIRPSKHLDLETCVLNVAAQIISALSAAGAMPYEELLKLLQATVSKQVRFNFILALDALFVLGLIEYDEDTDAVVLMKSPAEVHV